MVAEIDLDGRKEWGAILSLVSEIHEDFDGGDEV
jgi:hypothetical protein